MPIKNRKRINFPKEFIKLMKKKKRKKMRKTPIGDFIAEQKYNNAERVL